MVKLEHNEVLTVNELVDYLRINKQTIYNLLRKGQLPGKKIGGQWRFSKQVIEEFIQREK